MRWPAIKTLEPTIFRFVVVTLIRIFVMVRCYINLANTARRPSIICMRIQSVADLLLSGSGSSSASAMGCVNGASLSS